MIAKGKAIQHASNALAYALSKGEEITRHEVYSDNGKDIAQEMKPYQEDWKNVKNNILRFEVSPSQEESKNFTKEDWKILARDFIKKMELENTQYLVCKHTDNGIPHLHILANRVNLSGELYKDNFIGARSSATANKIAEERNLKQAQEIGQENREQIKKAVINTLREMKQWNFDLYKKKLQDKGIIVKESGSGYNLVAKSGTEYKASDIYRGLTLARIEKEHAKIQYQERQKEQLEKSKGFRL